MTIQELVAAFNMKYGHPVNPLPIMLHHQVALERLQLIQEELTELTEAMRIRSIVSLADALGDLAYVVYGTAVAYGLDLDPIIREIHRSNMTKEIGEFKPVKGLNYEQPDMGAEVWRQGYK